MRKVKAALTAAAIAVSAAVMGISAGAEENWKSAYLDMAESNSDGGDDSAYAVVYVDDDDISVSEEEPAVTVVDAADNRSKLASKRIGSPNTDDKGITSAVIGAVASGLAIAVTKKRKSD